jgi:hypothetical protein
MNKVPVEALPFLPMSKELKNLPSLPKELEEKMRFLARGAIEIMLKQISEGKIPPEVKKKMRSKPKAFCKKK